MPFPRIASKGYPQVRLLQPHEPHIKMMNNRGSRQTEKGTEILEFALVVSFILVPLLLGVVVIGINLGRAVQVAQVARDGGSMYVRGVDFSQAGNQAVLARLGQGLGLTTTG